VHTDGSPVTLTAGSNRLADTSPYWGGARIVISTSGCTSGFTMLQNTTRFLTTAGHCASGNGQNVTSGAGALIGTTSNRTLPNPDLMSIWPSQGQQHTNVIHTNGEDGAASRPVTSRIRNGVVNFCLSGSVSNSICTVTLVQDDVTICFPTGCTTNLYVAARNNNQVVRKGDSGGPAYGRDGSNASARGIIIGGNNNPDGTFAGTQVYMHNIGTLENQTGAGVAVF
jgi:hypothetical protein